MRKITLNSKLLDVLMLLKHRQALAISEQNLEIDGGKGWVKLLRNYYYELPETMITDLGLLRNERCIQAIQFFEIPEEWLTTNSDELGKFEFCF